ncbi:cobalamin (vitamin B12) biosynthesis CbiG protein [Desulfovibrio sp. X2]|uniref:cobalt-precorrin 5A hydrolase n=1 Tax=Desulfovibrio sp. X2 TaxID=941449 RepID=UPI000358B41E|nr:cobalamin biosynthesis protein [Desulfovibrio sp. X2]EPR44739.1 cobalamin (vitamin B12) biosynthesis CbiG protein [Desulfovibrio sp. X2]
MPGPASPLAYWACTAEGAALARRLAARLPGRVHLPARLTAGVPAGLPQDARGADEEGYDELLPLVRERFAQFSGHVFVCASGIAVRAVAPCIGSKDADPAVVVLSQDGRFAVPLLSGHLGGANALARELAEATGGQAVITTATDLAGVPAVDLLAKERDMAVCDLAAAKAVSAALLDGGRPGLVDPHGLLLAPGDARLAFFRPMTAEQARSEPLAVRVGWRTDDSAPGHLLLAPRVLCAGLGCRRGAGADEILDCLRGALADAGLAEQALCGLASADVKADEPGLAEAARRLGLDLTFFPAEALAGVDVPTPSARVRQAVGTPSVAEAAALLLARSFGTSEELLCTKKTCPRATAAVALARPKAATEHPR